MKEADVGGQIRVCEREKASMMETDLLVSRHKDENDVLTLVETVLNGVRDEEGNNFGHASNLSEFELRFVRADANTYAFDASYSFPQSTRTKYAFTTKAL